MRLVYDDVTLYDAALAFLTQMMILGLLPGVTSLATQEPVVGTYRAWSITIS